MHYRARLVVATPSVPQPLPTPEVDYDAAGPPHPTPDEFFSRITYPYHASRDQQQRIERAARIIRIGWTEAQVLNLLGQPDYKAGLYHFLYPSRT